MPTPETEPKPCPWCRKKPTSEEEKEGMGWCVYCHNHSCVASVIVQGKDEADAIRRWNGRES